MVGTGLVLLGLSEAVRRRRTFVWGDAARPRWRYGMIVAGLAFLGLALALISVT